MTRKATYTPKLPTVRISRNGSFYACTLEQVPSNTINIDELIICPCCQRPVYVAAETQQRGKYEDKYTLLFACVPCLKAWLYNYTLSNIELPDNGGENNA